MHPTWLYHKETIASLTYHRTPPGVFKPLRLLNNLPYYERIDFKEQSVPKHLILADSNAASWHIDKLRKVKEKCAQLLSEGFCISVWIDGQLKPLSVQDLCALDDISFRNRITQEVVSTIQKKAINQFHLDSYEQLHILDEHSLKCLMEESELSRPRYLELSDYVASHHLWPRAPKEPISFPILKTEKFKSSAILVNEWSPEALKMLEELKAEFPDLPIEYQYNSLSLDQGMLDQLREQQYTLEGTFLPSGITYLKVDGNITVQELCAFPALKELCLTSTDLTGLASSSFNAATLETLTLMRCFFSIEELQSLLERAPNLRTITIRNSNEVEFELDLRQPLPYLEKMHLCNEVHFKNDFATYVPALNTFRVQDINPSQIPPDLKLKKFTLHTSFCSGEDLIPFLNQQSNLEELTIEYCSELTTFPSIALKLPLLKKFALVQSKISNTGVTNLLAVMPELEELKLTFSDQSGEFNLENLYFASLKKLEISDSECSSQTLQNLLKHMPALEELVLMYNETPLTELDPEGLNLAAIKKLTLVNCEISQQAFENLIAHMPALEELELTQVNLSLEDLNDLDLTRVKRLKLDKYDLFPPEFPALELLDLSDCHNLTDFDLYEQAFPSLKMLIVQESAVSPQVLNKLSEQRPLLQVTVVPARDQFQIEQNQQDPAHDAQSHRDFKPTSDTFRFHFKGKNKTLDQSMVIEKLSQYLVLNGKNLDLIPKIQDGICNALSHLFLEKPNFISFLKGLRDWDGNQGSLPGWLVPELEELLDAIQYYQMHPSHLATYLGDALPDFLANTTQEKLILKNPWHAISLTYSPTHDVWTFYDPNSKKGPKALRSNQLMHHIERSLGTLVSVENHGLQFPPPCINDKRDFFRNGGLLALAENPHRVLPFAPQPQELYPIDFKGFFLRTTQGVPAWAHALSAPGLRNYTIQLLIHYVSKQANNLKAFQDSLGALKPEQRQDYIDLLLDSLKAKIPQDKLDSLLGLHAYTKQDYSDLLRPKPNTKPSLEDYLKKQLDLNGPKNRLIQIHSSQGVQALQCHLLAQAQKDGRPVFCINSPEDLVCSAKFIRRLDQEKGQASLGPGGPLHDFLTRHQDPKNPPLLLINYEALKGKTIRYHALLDQQLADNTPLPAHTQIIGLTNPANPDSYLSRDFISRFSIGGIESCPLLPPELRSFPLPEERSLSEVQDSEILYLEKDLSWKERLLGQWLYKKNNYVWEEGILTKALQSGKPIHIQNGLWQDPYFCAFWQQAQINGAFTHEGLTIPIPKGTIWTKDQGYYWEQRLHHITLKPGLVHGQELPVLNPSLSAQFEKYYQFDDQEETLDTLPGLLEQAQGSTLKVNLTRNLSDSQWSLLLRGCERYNVHLECHIPEGLPLPLWLEQARPVEEEMKAEGHQFLWDKETVSHYPLFLTSTDASTTIAQIKTLYPGWLSLDVSERDASDLLFTIDCHYDDQQLNPKLKKRFTALITSLAAGKKIILRGPFPKELMDELAVFLLEPLKSGQLILVSERQEDFQAFQEQIVHHEVSVQDKQKHLAADLLSEDLIAQESLELLAARLRYLKLHPGGNSDLAWLGLENLPKNYLDLKPFSPEHSQKDAQQIDEDRLEAVLQILQDSPFVFIAGLTGVGKTSFVQHILGKLNKVYIDDIKAWRNDKALDGKDRILFIDEATLYQGHWSEFEGLLQDPPFYIEDGILHTLPHHKVIFAGNPASDKNGRHVANLFYRHGNSIVFNPLPPNYLYERLLKPIVQGTVLEAHSEALAKPLLDVYSFVAQHIQDEVLISPREIQTMALLLRAYAIQEPNSTHEDHLLAAAHYAYTVGKLLLPQELQAEFCSRFAPPRRLPREFTRFKTTANYLVTPSREEHAQLVQDFINLRLMEIQESQNQSLGTGGIRSLVFEGEAGVGKTKLILETLKANGYEQGKGVYYLPMSLQEEDKLRILQQAFQEGAFLVVDELNSVPLNEKEWNSLLMGRDLHGNPPDKPGFRVLASQNGLEYGARSDSSIAMKRRGLLMHMDNYPTEEQAAILRHNNAGAGGIEPLLGLGDFSFRELEALSSFSLEKNRESKQNQLIVQTQALPISPGIHKAQGTPLFFSHTSTQGNGEQAGLLMKIGN